MPLEDYFLFGGPARSRITINITEISGYRYLFFILLRVESMGLCSRNSPNFDFTSPSDLSDCSLIVDGNTIHVNKQVSFLYIVLGRITLSFSTFQSSQTASGICFTIKPKFI